MNDTTAAGLVLIALVPLLAAEAVLYTRARVGGAFWRLPLDEKLDHVAGIEREWWGLGIVWVGMLTVTVAGLAASAFVLSDVWGWVGFGAATVAAMAWLFGITTQTAATAVASRRRGESGETPPWIHPLWQMGWMYELTWVIVANLGYAAVGLAVLHSDPVATWAGWALIGTGATIAIAIAAWPSGAFPQLGLIAPIVLAVAMLTA